MRLSEVKEEAWRARPHAIPTKIVPDFEALFDSLQERGWLVLEPPPVDHRTTTLGALESKLIKDFKNWMLNNRRLMLNTKRIGQYRWYLTIGAPYMRKPKKGQTQ